MEINWVAKRAKCSAHSFLKSLELGARTDKEAREKQREAGSMLRFEVLENGSHFTVIRHHGQDSVRSVRFSVSGNDIEVLDQSGALLLRGTITLGGNGECQLKTGTEQLEGWQVRHRCLEDLFFAD